MTRNSLVWRQREFTKRGRLDSFAFHLYEGSHISQGGWSICRKSPLNGSFIVEGGYWCGSQIFQLIYFSTHSLLQQWPFSRETSLDVWRQSKSSQSQWLGRNTPDRENEWEKRATRMHETLKARLQEWQQFCGGRVKTCSAHQTHECSNCSSAQFAHQRNWHFPSCEWSL